MTELVIRIDLKDMIDNLPEKVEVVRQVVPAGYKCGQCWQDDGKHASSCIHRSEGKVE